MNVYKLVATDIRNVGSMSTMNNTPVILDKLFSSLDSAKAAAELHYSERGGSKTITWKRSGKGVTSGDLSYVMYDINPEPVL